MRPGESRYNSRKLKKLVRRHPSARFQKVASFERSRHSFPPEAVENSGVMATNPDYKAEKGTRRAARLPVRPTRRRTPERFR